LPESLGERSRGVPVDQEMSEIHCGEVKPEDCANGTEAGVRNSENRAPVLPFCANPDSPNSVLPEPTYGLA
jgi:hypothetical protein